MYNQNKHKTRIVQSVYPSFRKININNQNKQLTTNWSDIVDKTEYSWRPTLLKEVSHRKSILWIVQCHYLIPLERQDDNVLMYTYNLFGLATLVNFSLLWSMSDMGIMNSDFNRFVDKRSCSCGRTDLACIVYCIPFSCTLKAHKFQILLSDTIILYSHRSWSLAISMMYSHNVLYEIKAYQRTRSLQ
mgnify:CR=1 FL=1